MATETGDAIYSVVIPLEGRKYWLYMGPNATNWSICSSSLSLLLRTDAPERGLKPLDRPTFRLA